MSFNCKGRVISRQGVVGEVRFFDDTVKALADYATIKAKPDEPKLYDNRAQIYFKHGKYDLSDEDYNMLFLLLVLNVVGKTI